MANIYEKLQQVRVDIAAKAIHKGGENKFAGYKYFELSDFLPVALPIFQQYQLCPLVSFTADQATLTIIDCAKPEDRIIFSSPMAEANLKGAHAIQNLGAVETYQRRYLYMTALEIVEPDALDSSKPLDDKPAEKKQEAVSPNPKDFPPDDRPWISDAQVVKAVERIRAGEECVLDAAKVAFKISKANRAKLEAAAPAPLEKVPNDLPF